MKVLAVRRTGMAALVFGVVYLFRILGGIPMPSTSVMTGVLGFTLLLLFFSKRIAMDGLFFVFLLYLGCNLLIMDPPTVFHSWERLVIFVELMLLVSPLLKSDDFREFRRKAMKCVLILSVAVSVSSFVAYFVGINLMSGESGEYFSEYSNMGGTFGGVTKQSMILGLVSGAAVCYMSYCYYRTCRRAYLCLALVCMASVFFAASRGALLATIVAVLVVLYYASHSKLVFFKTLTGVVLCLLLTFPLWKDVTAGVQQKQESRSRMDGAFDSRTDKFAARVAEFKSSPVVGIGFSSVDPNGKDFYNRKTGTIEPGSSFLAVLAMTGLVGFAFVSTIILLSFTRSGARSRDDGVLLKGLIMLFGVHMLIEGYIFAAGSPLCMFFWLVVGVSFDSRTAICQILPNAR